MRWVGLIVAIVVMGVAFGANRSDAHAHAQYIRSQPEQNIALAQSPIEVLIWFTESVEIQFSEIQVVDATGDDLRLNSLLETLDGLALFRRAGFFLFLRRDPVREELHTE